MTLDQYISVRETAQILGISEKKVMDLIEEDQLHGYRIADQFLRLKKSEVMILKHTGQVVSEQGPVPYSSVERIRDFFYFNDFYIFSLIAMGVLLYLISRG